MTDGGQRRDGFALLLAILGVVIAGALIIATHAAVRLDHSVAVAALLRQRAFAASEHGLWHSLANWNPAGFALPVGGVSKVVVPAGGDSATVTIVRLSGEIYWVVAEAEVGDGSRSARRRTAVNVRASADSTGVRAAPLSRAWAELH